MSLARSLTPHLPPLRRYARALTGSQTSGDAFVRAALEAIVEGEETIREADEPRVGLYQVFHRVWSSGHVEVPDPDNPLTPHEQQAQKRLGTLTPASRQALLLTGLEGFTLDQAARILGVDEDQARGLIDEAYGEIERQTATRVLIIEDEPLVSMDLEGIVEELGHQVSSVARTHGQAVDAIHKEKPGLVLADIQLADGSSGIDAVREIIQGIDVPVVFVTAYPERLLTGERPEPTFLITKPYNPATVKATISQALFFEENAHL